MNDEAVRTRWYYDCGFWLAVFLPVATGLPSWGMDFFYGDESRHAMNGILILDWLRAGCPSPKDFALQYYARYPALSLGYHPPLFPAIAACFYWVSGFSIESARLAAWMCGMIGAGFWYQMLKEWKGRMAAILGSLALWCAPGVVYWNRAIMSEIPAIAMLAIAGFWLLRFSRTGIGRNLCLAAISGGLAVSAKQTTIWWLLAAVVFLGWQTGWRNLFTRRMAMAGAIYILFILPIALLTITVGQTNISKNVGWGANIGRLFSLANWSYYLAAIPKQIGWPATILAIIGCVMTLKERRIPLARAIDGENNAGIKTPNRHPGDAGVFFLLWLAANYLVMSLFLYKSMRLGLLGVPPLAAMAAISAMWLSKKTPHFSGKTALLFTFLFPFQIIGVHTPSVRGFAELAEFAQKNWSGETLLYDGAHSGSFIVRLREIDPNRRRIVLRGSKSLSATQVMSIFGVKALVATEEEILRFLREHHTGIIILENKDMLDLPHSRMLRQLVKNRPDLFQQLTLPPVAMSEEFAPCLPITAYRMTGNEPARQHTKKLKLHFPIIGDAVDVTIH